MAKKITYTYSVKSSEGVKNFEFPEKSVTVRELKEISKEADKKAQFFRFNNKSLNDDEYVVAGQMVEAHDGICITVNCPDYKTVSLYVDPYENVLNVKQMIEKAKQKINREFPVDMMRLLFNNSILDNTKYLNDYNVCKNAVLKVERIEPPSSIIHIAIFMKIGQFPLAVEKDETIVGLKQKIKDYLEGTFEPGQGIILKLANERSLNCNRKFTTLRDQDRNDHHYLRLDECGVVDGSELYAQVRLIGG